MYICIPLIQCVFRDVELPRLVATCFPKIEHHALCRTEFGVHVCMVCVYACLYAFLLRNTLY
jgi:hypothetical protein